MAAPRDDDGFTSWAQELSEHQADLAEDPRERIEADDFTARFYDLAPFTPAFTRVAEVGRRE